ncbi:hypothetical protein Ddc_06858 [Ditylenchus destructor]|nr:hypothetical protein Ddc_06858 [Ditylenchus destructor]
MHNARIVSRDRLSDFCQTPSAGDLNAASEFFDSRRLQLLMSLYRRDLTSVVLLVGRDPQYHIHNRTHFARICEQTAELHFDPLEIQLSQIEAQDTMHHKEILLPLTKDFSNLAMSSFIWYPTNRLKETTFHLDIHASVA